MCSLDRKMFRSIEGESVENNGGRNFIKSWRNTKGSMEHMEFLKRKIKQFKEKKADEGLDESEELYLISLKESLLKVNGI